MAFITADRVKDTSTTTGTGNITVSGGAPSGYRTFSTVLSVNDTFYYCVTGQASSEWEVGLGTYLSTNTFARTTVLASSASNSAVSFSSGTKNVFITLPANKTLQLDAAASPTAGAILYGTGSMLAYTAVGTSGQFLQSTGSGAPTWAPFGSVGTSISNGTSNVNISSSNGAVTVATNGTTAITVDTSQNVTVAGTVAMSSSFKRNRIINGNMGVWQRGTSGFTTNNAYCADRWVAKADTSFTSAAQSSDVPAGYQYSLTVTGTGYAGIFQKIEAANCYGLVGNSVTVSFWAKQTTGAGTNSLSVGLFYPTAGVDDYTSGVTQIGSSITATGTTSWAQYSVTFSSLSSNALNGLVPYILSNVAGASTILLTGVQLEVGTKATPYEMQIYSDQLAQCQRYYSKSYNIDVAPGTVTYVGSLAAFSPTASANRPVIPIFFPVSMRTTPTLTAYSPNNGASGNFYNNDASANFAVQTSVNTGSSGASWLPSGTMTANAFFTGHWVATSEL